MTANTKSELSLTINGQPQQLTVSTLADALYAGGYDADRVATAVNGAFVPRASRAQHTLTDGDRIEILTARQGG